MIWFFWTKPVQVSRAIRYYRIQSHPLTHFHNLFYGYERGFYYFLFKQSLKTFSLWHVKAWGGKDRGGKIQISGGTIYLYIVQKKKKIHGLHQKTNNLKIRYIIYRDRKFFLCTFIPRKPFLWKNKEETSEPRGILCGKWERTRNFKVSILSSGLNHRHAKNNNNKE